MSERIAVLGAGPMGLAVAYELARRGHKPVLFEAADRIGGMTACFDFDGTEIERFYHFHCTSDDALFALLAELGLADAMRWRETHMAYWYGGRLQPWGNPKALLAFKGLSLMAKLRYGLHAFVCTKRRDWRALDRLEATHWLRRAVGEEAFEVLWRRLFDYKFYNLSGEVSAAWIWSRIRRIGRSRSDLFREKLGYIEGGSATLLNALRAAIEAGGGEIHLNAAVREIVISGGRVEGLRLDHGTEPFGKVISTIPLPYLPALLPGLPDHVRARYAAVKNIAVACVIFKLARPVTENFWVNVNDPDFEIPGVVEYSNLRPLGAHIVYVPFYMPAEHPHWQWKDDRFIATALACLRRINPALTAADVMAARCHRYRHAQPVCTPGFLDRLPPVALSVTGLWAADTSYYYPEDRGIAESVAFGRAMAAMAAA